jgi:hypothetical protein
MIDALCYSLDMTLNIRLDASFYWPPFCAESLPHHHIHIINILEVATSVHPLSFYVSRMC